eukprot:6462186-Amphidinium_carterae.2
MFMSNRSKPSCSKLLTVCKPSEVEIPSQCFHGCVQRPRSERTRTKLLHTKFPKALQIAARTTAEKRLGLWVQKVWANIGSF